MPSAKYDVLVDRIRSYGSAVVALSGGVDSTLLARAAAEALGERALAVTGSSPSIPAREIDHARRVAVLMGVRHRVVETHEMDDPRYVANATNRCYFCKSELYDVLLKIAEEERFEAILSGDNLDDLADHRPGRRAALERRVRFPLQDAGLTKDDIRAISRDLALPTWDRPASPCLSSRVAYGDPIDATWLDRIDRAERFLHELGFPRVRVRHHRDLARIEVPAVEIEHVLPHRERIEARLRELGWTFVALDLGGYRSGSLNQVRLRPAGA